LVLALLVCFLIFLAWQYRKAESFEGPPPTLNPEPEQQTKSEDTKPPKKNPLQPPKARPFPPLPPLDEPVIHDPEKIMKQVESIVKSMADWPKNEFLSGTLQKQKQLIDDFLNNIQQPAASLNEMVQSRGIVFTVPPKETGNEIPNVLVAVKVLRNKGINLPVHIYYEPRLSGQSPFVVKDCLKAAAQALNTKILPFDFAGIDSVPRSGYIFKPLAILYAPFKEVIFADADCTMLTHPDALFAEANKRDVTALFWSDIRQLNHQTPIWKFHNVTEFNEHNLGGETGQIVVRKDISAIKALSLTTMMLYYTSIFTSQVYFNRNGWGDASIFIHSWAIASSKFAFGPDPQFGGLKGACVNTLLQMGFNGKVAFFHHNGLKCNGLSEWKRYERKTFECFSVPPKDIKQIKGGSAAYCIDLPTSTQKIACDQITSAADGSPLALILKAVQDLEGEGLLSCFG